MYLRLGTGRFSYIALIVPLWLGWLQPGVAFERLRVVALFPDKAMVEIDGRNRLLRVGMASPEGILLISADAHGAIIEVNGKRESYQLGSHVAASFVQPKLREVRIQRGANGAYLTVGTINGQQVDMLLDTGATKVAMSEPAARRLGLQYKLEGTPTGVRTASGSARGYALTLDRVAVGAIILRNVEALVIEGDAPQQVLLGMSFLQRVDMDNQGAVLLLRSKF